MGGDVDEHVARLAVEDAIGFKLHEDAWEEMQRIGLTEGFLAGKVSVDELTSRARALQEELGPPIPIEGQAAQMLTEEWSGTSAYTPQDEAISRAVAEMMAQDDEVRAFRSDPRHKLPYGLLPWDDLLRWMREVSPIETEEPTWYVEGAPVTDPPPDALKEIVERGTQGVTISTHVPPERLRSTLTRRYLVFSMPGEVGESRIAVAHGGTLDRLREVSEHASRRVGWTPAQAAVFVLTGWPPLVKQMRAKLIERDIPRMSRVRLDIDPGMSPREVADEYRRVRQYLVGKRHRDLTDKYLQLAIFTLTKLQGATLDARMQAWNEAHPEWGYAFPSEFGRDAQLAQNRLLGITRSERADRLRKQKKESDA